MAASRSACVRLTSTDAFFSFARRSAYRATTASRCLLRAIFDFLAM
ncbi:hypothetical protein HMPREF0043_00267 [Actinobaculum sp. oral taxon 183 str. F0552]|nr:hypothetical protein HMPREF0043_00267 [Actinobaculum sp. oral taxon 183 str. F0552]